MSLDLRPEAAIGFPEHPPVPPAALDEAPGAAPQRAAFDRAQARLRRTRAQATRTGSASAARSLAQAERSAARAWQALADAVQDDPAVEAQSREVLSDLLDTVTALYRAIDEAQLEAVRVGLVVMPGEDVFAFTKHVTWAVLREADSTVNDLRRRLDSLPPTDDVSPTEPEGASE